MRIKAISNNQSKIGVFINSLKLNSDFLNFLIPGVGQIYNGKVLRGLFWLIITPGFWIGTGGLLGWVCHVVSAYTAYGWAVEN